ncbi:2-dehydro-3-deoxy-6-phosphogalactonate aldolase [Paraburkholderia elongata]|uniref:2-dehydro-3-deoxy-6-phosphogalactonate aldolase n=1 Tax=Paraburkholderia elongata TaxID=2675747 RepID=A0A972NLW0_9BURK|nr:2-dehydro-3-deoxy-6-phosphogalactonate aldolase [Paraburkholderia elongata]NPT55336.1 2-dehydro-3-deoxy-6-phosphogalactonate aldolase [Paraburkholderia elongata]
MNKTLPDRIPLFPHAGFAAAMSTCPLIAILRGLTPEHAEPIGRALYEAGFRAIEVPLNSPDPLQSIRTLRDTLPPDVLVGAGTVLLPSQVTDVADSGGTLIVMPHSDPTVIRAAKAAGLACTPGVATPTEAFAALFNGADALKLFPADRLSPSTLRAWRTVIPTQMRIMPVGGVTPGSLKAYIEAGAGGFGLGSSLYQPGFQAELVSENANLFITCLEDALAPAAR